MSKSSNYRIRVEPKLHQEFLDACRSEDKPAAQVIREFMRAYVEKSYGRRQTELFVSEAPGSYKSQEK